VELKRLCEIFSRKGEMNTRRMIVALKCGVRNIAKRAGVSWKSKTI